MRAVKEVQERMAVPPGGGPSGPAGPVDKVRSWPGQVRQFLHDVRQELRNVTWPSWNDARATTVVVLVATFFFGFYLGFVLDLPFHQLMKSLLEFGRRLVG
ncbi:MAG: preprotein translocase subunit SecE [Terriglobia bacterium]